MDLQRLKYFLEVARQKNFSKAARVCRVSQPSLSQQIKKLEEEVGGALFLRSRGTISLSAHGEAFLKHAQAIIGEVSAAEEFVTRSQDDTERTIRFGAIPTVAPYLIPQIFQRIQGVFSTARFELVESVTDSLVEFLRTGMIDFALLSPPTKADHECDYLTLVEDEFLLTLPVGHPLCATKSITAEDLKCESFMLLENSHCLAQQAATYCEEMGLGANVCLRGTQIDTLLGLVEQGFGLTFTPSIATSVHPHRKVVFRSLATRRCYREVRLAWLRRQFLSKSHELVIGSLQRTDHHLFPSGPVVERPRTPMK